MTKHEILDQIGDLIEDLLDEVSKEQEDVVRDLRRKFQEVESRVK